MPYNRTGAGSSTYSDYAQEHEYATDTGLLPLPVAGRTPKVRLIRLHGGMGLRTVRWVASRTGVPPIIPAAISTAYDTLIGHTVTPNLPTPNPQTAGYDWTVQGEYKFVQTTPRVPGTDTLPTGGLPFAVAPMDSLANDAVRQAAPYIQVGAGQNPFDLVVKAIAETVDHATGRFLWPFTSLPPKFTSDDLIGG